MPLVPPSLPSARSRRWCFTINHPTPAISEKIFDLNVTYSVVGREIAPTTGTPHLQGFLIFPEARNRAAIIREVGAGHWVPARGTSLQASDYCKKHDDFIEHGELPTKSGKRTDIDLILEWLDDFIKATNRAPNAREVTAGCPRAMLRYRDFVGFARLRAPLPTIRVGEPKVWQRELEVELLGDANDRTILFYVDPTGGSGKTWFIQWFWSRNQESCQILATGKRDDVAFSVDESKSIFLMNVARGSMQFFQYSILENLKDQLVPSPKYASCMKTLLKCPHVVVFCNEEPDMAILTEDRYDIRVVNKDDA